MNTKPEAYPLHWPIGRPRTPSDKREWGRFKTTPEAATDGLFEELRRLGAKLPILSTNVELRLDGMPYASRRPPDDPGVAVYFEYHGKQFTFACDRYDQVHKNIRAIGKTIENLRGIERWGTGDMLKQAFAGFIALPAPEAEKPWWEVLAVERDLDWTEVQAKHKRLALLNHPDRGGNHDRMAEINAALEKAKQEKG